MHKYDEKRINKLNVPKPRIKAKDFVFDDIYYMVQYNDTKIDGGMEVACFDLKKAKDRISQADEEINEGVHKKMSLQALGDEVKQKMYYYFQNCFFI